MTLSLIIVSYNTKELLTKCLRSVDIACRDLKYETFVVDNNSTDGSSQMVEKEFPYVKLIKNQKNLGFSRANNQALKLARGKYVLVLNPDTRLFTDTITKMIKFMGELPQVGIATCRVELPDGRLDRDCRRRFPTPWRAFTHFSSLSKIFKGTQLFDSYHMGYLKDNTQHEIDSCAGSFMLIRKKDLDRVGFFDEDFFFYGEDLDLCWRLRQAGYKIVYTPIAKIIHYKGVASGMKSISKHLTKATKESKRRALAESVRAMELFYRKHYVKQYPFFINWIVLVALKLLQIYRTNILI